MLTTRFEYLKPGASVIGAGTAHANWNHGNARYHERALCMNSYASVGALETRARLRAGALFLRRAETGAPSGL